MIRPTDELMAELTKIRAAFDILNNQLTDIEAQIEDSRIGDIQYSTIVKYIEKYLSLGDGDFKTDLEQEFHEDGVILYKRLQNNLNQLSAFEKDRQGSTFALKRTLEMFIEQGFLIEMDREEMKATYGTGQRAFKIITQ